MTAGSPRIALGSPAAPSPDDRAWGLCVTPWLPPAGLAAGWHRGDALAADRILVPFTFGTTSASPFAAPEGMRRFLALLPWFREAPERHLLLDNSDTDAPYDCLDGAVLFKTSASLRFPGVLPLPYCVPDPGEPVPIVRAELDLAFQGSLDTHPVRDWMDRWRHSWHGMRTEVRALPRPFWQLDPRERAGWTASYAGQMQRTRFVLCP
ncbi:MAG TPA: hypothetical protein VF705_05160, partial [Longimicrobium sp.]